MITKGVVLAGGSGTRLLPLTKVTNKHLIGIYDRPMIYFSLQTLINANIKDIMIVAGKGHAGSFLELLGDGSEFGINLSYTVQEKSGGIAQALGLTKRFANNDNIVVILADNIYEDTFDFSDFREGARVYLKRVSDPQKFGVARVVDLKLGKGKIVEIVEKPDISKVDNELIDKNGYGFSVTGLYLYDNTIFDRISCLRPSNRGELEISDLNNMYIRDGKIDFEIVNGFWSDMGTIESAYRASSFVRDKTILKK